MNNSSNSHPDATATERRIAEKHWAEDQLEALLLDGLRGEMQPLTADDLRDIRQEAMAKLKARKAEREQKRIATT